MCLRWQVPSMAVIRLGRSALTLYLVIVRRSRRSRTALRPSPCYQPEAPVAACGATGCCAALRPRFAELLPKEFGELSSLCVHIPGNVELVAAHASGLIEDPR